MIKQIDLKETKRILIAQLVLSTIYFLFGVYILISNIINKNIAFNKDLNITLSLIIIGGVYAIYLDIYKSIIRDYKRNAKFILFEKCDFSA